jgi:hypothetical protein
MSNILKRYSDLELKAMLDQHAQIGRCEGQGRCFCDEMWEELLSR